MIKIISSIFRKLIPYWFLISIFLLFIIFLFGLYTYFRYVDSIATPFKLMNSNNTGIILYDRKGRIFYQSPSVKPIQPVSLTKIPKFLTDATLSIEDKDFYRHSGFSGRGILRSIGLNIRTGSNIGGSTITQQLVKNAILSDEKTFRRKFQELILSFEVERRYSKDQILEMYLNSIYYGSGAYGAGQASLLYFNKDISKINLAESAILAALPQSPSRLTPYGGDREALFSRQKIVFKEMKNAGFIGEAEYEKGLEEKVVFAASRESDDNLIQAPHFGIYIREYLFNRYGEDKVIRNGFKITTSLDASLQAKAQSILQEKIRGLAEQKVTNGGAITINPATGEIIVYVGSKDWNDTEFGKFDIVQALRQPGSSFKPVVYSAAFIEGHKTTDILHDKRSDFSGYMPENYDRKFRGDVTLRRALSNSLNVPSVELLNDIGIEKAMELAASMGITTLTDIDRYGLSLVLGGGEVKLSELTRAYGILSYQGELVNTHPILKIEDKAGNIIYSFDSSTLEEVETINKNIPDLTELIGLNDKQGKLDQFTGGRGKKQVIEAKYAYLTTDVLSDRSAREEIFTGVTSLNLSRPGAVKTGTTDDYRDSWTIGYTPDYVTGVWIGNNDNSPMNRVAGSVGAAPIWHDIMEEIHRGLPIRQFPKPAGIVELNICKDTLLPSCNDCSESLREVFSIETAPEIHCQSPVTLAPTEVNPEEEDHEKNNEEDNIGENDGPTETPPVTITEEPSSTHPFISGNSHPLTIPVITSGTIPPTILP